MMDWLGCYSSGWRNEIVPEAFSHPAKFARGLIRRIYEHAIEQGYLKPGDWVADPFAGTGLGAADALALGLNWFGNELEQSFVDIGTGCDCTGISKADWVTCFGRWKRFAHKDGRLWCPRCLAEAERIIEPRPPTLPGMGLEPTASYERNSGKIPHTEPHYYSGNLDLFARHARNGARAILVQGDSRRLCEVLEGARVKGLISSPPFSPDQPCASQTRALEDYHAFTRGDGTKRDHVMRSSGNLGNMPTGDPPQGIIASPPYATQTVHDRCDIDPDKLTGNPPGPHSQALTMANYGDSEGQLGTMPTGEPPQAVIASPPYTGDGVGHDAGHPRLDAVEDARRGAEGCGRRPAYGESDGQLAAMREGEPPAGIVQVDACVSSPPWEKSVGTVDGDEKFWIERERRWGSRTASPRRREIDPGTYGQDSDNLGNQQGDTFWSAARAILLQCYQVLAPGGVAIFVTKRFVRNKAIVEFSQQWADLCQSCGFELIEWIKVWLVEERGTQYDLTGEARIKRVRHFSFFRWLHTQKYPHLAIEWEDVLIFRKPTKEMEGVKDEPTTIP